MVEAGKRGVKLEKGTMGIWMANIPRIPEQLTDQDISVKTAKASFHWVQWRGGRTFKKKSLWQNLSTEATELRANSVESESWNEDRGRGITWALRAFKEHFLKNKSKGHRKAVRKESWKARFQNRAPQQAESQNFGKEYPIENMVNREPMRQELRK